MGDPNILKTLRSKRGAIEGAIALYENKIKAARIDLAHVNAALRLFQAPEGRTQFPVADSPLRFLSNVFPRLAAQRCA